MTIFLILAPYGAFTFLMLVASATASVFTASAICLATIAIDIARGRSVKILAAGSAILFAGIGVDLALLNPALSTPVVKASVDFGVFVISLGSMLVRRPFTLQYALEAVPAETAAMPGFLRANYIITAAWCAATLLMLASNIVLLYVPGLPIWSSLAVAFAARNSAIYFTKWYPEYRRIKYGTPADALPAS
jgi:hypothetical protein